MMKSVFSRKSWARLAALSGALVLLGAGQATAEYLAGDVANGGTIKGMVKFKGTPPAPEKLEVNKDTSVCALTEKLNKDLVVDANGGIQFAVVSLTDIKLGKKFPEEKPTLDQKGCEYLPHVTLVPAGKEMEILNSDGILHNIHTYGEKNKPVNMAQPKFKKVIKTSFAEPERVKVACDVHGWMKGWIVVEDHPYYAETDSTGAFSLTDVPAGEYEIQVWQEKLGTAKQKVTVPASGEVSVNFELGQ